jgi:hypothetical protein
MSIARGAGLSVMSAAGAAGIDAFDAGGFAAAAVHAAAADHRLGELSTVAARRAVRAELIRRVVERGTMPPPGTELDAADRQAIAS